ncbi:MAG: hypothetical protein M1834_004652 [Cirrosporium novae-zelandiae]|nr:MAG: hypothetical protein M1834_004652 [Cirrosporium novae-zelandiae]
MFSSFSFPPCDSENRIPDHISSSYSTYYESDPDSISPRSSPFPTSAPPLEQSAVSMSALSSLFSSSTVKPPSASSLASYAAFSSRRAERQMHLQTLINSPSTPSKGSESLSSSSHEQAFASSSLTRSPSPSRNKSPMTDVPALSHHSGSMPYTSMLQGSMHTSNSQGDEPEDEGIGLDPSFEVGNAAAAAALEDLREQRRKTLRRASVRRDVRLRVRKRPAPVQERNTSTAKQ